MADGEFIEGVAVEENGNGAMLPVPVASAPPMLFRTDEPDEVLERASKVATSLAQVIKQRNLFVKIGRSEHVLVEGWQTCGAMLGVFAVKEWVRELPWPDPIPEGLQGQKSKGLTFGYEASFKAVRGDQIIGGAEATCKRTDGNWKVGEDNALESMAQTRATAKALRSVLAFIVTLAGYSPTPAEEAQASIPAEPASGGRVQAPPQATARPAEATEKLTTSKQWGMLNAKAAAAHLSPAEFANIVREVAGLPTVDEEEDERASAWLNRNRDRFPARFVGPLKDKLIELEVK